MDHILSYCQSPVGGYTNNYQFSIKIKKIMARGMPKDKSTKQKLLHRIKIARGHLNKVVNMVETDQYCIDVVHQSLAVQAALREFDNAVLTNHLKTCVASEIKRGNVTEVIDEVMKVVEKK